MSMKDYKDYPDSVYVPFSQDCFKNESTAQDLRNSDFLEYQFTLVKKILKTIVLKRIHDVLAPLKTFHFNYRYVFKIKNLIFSLLVHYTSPSSPFPPVPVVNIMSRDTTPVTKCLYHFVPPTTWEMKIITKPHP